MTEFVILLVLLILSGVFSGSETAIVDLSIGRVEGLVKEGRHGANALYQLKSNPSRMLSTIRCGNNRVNSGASVMATDEPSEAGTVRSEGDPPLRDHLRHRGHLCDGGSQLRWRSGLQ